MITSVLSESFSVDSRGPPKQFKSRTITMNKLIEMNYRKRYILIVVFWYLAFLQPAEIHLDVYLSKCINL